MGDRLLTTDEAAERLRLKAQTLRAMRSRGSGPAAVYISQNRVVYREEDISAFIASRRATSTADAQTRGLAPSGRAA